MKILMLNHNVIWRSTFFRAFYFGRELVERGHEVTIATISPDRVLRPRRSVVEGVKVVETPDIGIGRVRTGWDPWDALWRCVGFSRRSYHLIHGFDCRPAVLAPSLYLSLTNRVPWVSDWADWWGRGGAISARKSWIGRVAFAPVETFLEERFRRFAAQLTVTSTKLQKRAHAMGLSPHQVHYIPSGANVRTVTVRDMATCRRALDLPGDVPLATFVGYVQYDLELAIRGFAVALRRVPTARLLLVGPRNREVGRWISELGLEGRVTQAGVQPFERVPLYLGASDLLLMPCSDNLMNQARGPIKLGDYLAAGRPILANPVGDMVAVFRADRVGQMASPTPESYGEAMAGLLEDRARCAALGRRAREVAEQKYAWSLLTPQLEQVYRRAQRGL